MTKLNFFLNLPVYSVLTFFSLRNIFLLNFKSINHILSSKEIKLDSTNVKKPIEEIELAYKRICRINRFLKKNVCLNNTLTLIDYLSFCLVRFDFFIGVKFSEEDSFSSHSWVIVDNKLINDDTNIEDFKIIYSMSS
tara:strand:- start:154 stop:564 length:411 start_codon:yes stop_codon:yes gene_type:complete